MEDYKAQYYNEALLHYGVKGMKWGVRRKRIAKAAKAAKNYGKSYARLMGNAYIHPVRTMTAYAGLNRNAKMKTILRRNAGLYSGKELNAMNTDVRKQGRNMKRIKSRPKTKTKLAKPQPIRRVYETTRLAGHSLRHPIRTGIALSEANRNKRMKTILRRQAFLSTNEMRALSDDVRAQNTFAKKRKYAENWKKYNKIVNKQTRKIRQKKKRR